jgi:mono/diheme cytochrome c family protein
MKVTTLAAGLTLLAGMAQAADVQQGKAEFNLWCAGCHRPMTGGGFFVPAGTYVLQQQYQGKLPAALEERTDLTAPYIKTMIRTGRNIMPASRKTEISDADAENIAAYLTRNTK